MVLNDGSCWTIIGVEAVEFTFNQGLACVPTPVTPFPVILGLEVRLGGPWVLSGPVLSGLVPCPQRPQQRISLCVLQVNGGGHVAMLEIHGENFSPHLKVWFGTIETDTMYK